MIFPRRVLKEGDDGPMTDNLDQEISDAAERLAAIGSQIEEIRRRFIDASAEFLRSWFERAAKVQVTDKEYVTKGLSEDKYKELKIEVMGLREDSRAIAEQFLMQDYVWWTPGKLVRDSHDIGLKTALKYAAGTLIPVLIKFGYPDPFPNRRASGLEGPRWDTDLEWSQEMVSLEQDYSPLAAQGCKLQTAIQELKRKRDQKEAADRWEKL